MARDFERSSSEYIQCAIGALDHTGSGGATHAAIIYLESVSGGNNRIVTLATSTPTARAGMYINSTGRLAHSAGAGSIGTTVLALNTWYILVATKTGGTSTPRLHILDMAAGTWVHEDGSVTDGDWTTPGGTGFVQIGRRATADNFDGRMALVASWKRALTDAEVEQLAGGFRAWLALRPDGIWPLNQGAVADGVVDWSGNGANQSAISGTTISAEHPVRWRWGGAIRRVQRVSGATLYSQSVAGTLTSSGGLVQRAAKTLAGTMTSAGGLAKQANLTKAGALTSAGAVVRLAAKSLAGALTSGGALVKQAARTLAGGLTTAGGLTKAPSTTFAGSITPAGALTRRTAKPIAGTLTTTGGLVRQTTKALAGALTSDGTLTKRAARSFVGTLTPDGGLSRLTAKGFGGMLTLAGALATASYGGGSVAFIGAIVAVIRDAGATALADAINGAASGTDSGGGTTSGAGYPPQ